MTLGPGEFKPPICGFPPNNCVVANVFLFSVTQFQFCACRREQDDWLVDKGDSTMMMMAFTCSQRHSSDSREGMMMRNSMSIFDFDFHT